MNKFLIGLSLALPAMAQAKEVKISVDTYTYSSPASLLLDLTQQWLAIKAVEACGKQEAVLGLNDITIKAKRNLDMPVANLETKDGGPSLMLNYPMITATATALCAD